jgi:DNA primase
MELKGNGTVLLAVSERGSTVPGIDFSRIRAEITMEQVLDLLGFQPSRRSGVQWYGSCPLHESRSGHRRSFSVNVAVGRYFCHGCRSHGNQLELWAAATKLPLHQAALDLCHRLGRDIPWIRRW